MSNVEKFSVSMSQETLEQLEYLRQKLGLYPRVKRSQLIRQVIFDSYCRHMPVDPVIAHGFPDCPDDCRHCEDQYVCDYSKDG